MTEDNIKQNTASDDIDLIGLLESIYLFFRRFRNVFFIAAITGILLGFIFYFASPKAYQSKLILHSSYLTNQEELEIIDYWNQLLKRNEHKILASILNCREELLNKLISLEGVEIQKNYSSTDPNGFYIDARINDNSILPELQEAIVHGLNNTEYVKQKISERQEYLKELINKVTTEINKLDSVKNSIENSIIHESKNFTSPLVTVESLTKDIIDMNEKLLSYKSELRSLGSIHVLQGFIPLTSPVSRGLPVTIIMGLILCLSVAYLFSLLKYIEDRLKKRVKSDARK
ncbi:MAG: hypothetical protein ACHQF0_05885 [Chitinophagales bacterium]